MDEAQTIAGKYRIDRELGRGGMGVVYRARDAERNMDVAIKTIPPELAHHREFLQRFQLEARALMRLHHPNIVGLIDLIQDKGSHYMVLEYVDGPSLAQVLTKGPLPPERAREIALQVCDALTHAHQHNIVHRDIKPSNILLTKEGQAKVTDFGIARVLDATLGTLTGKVFGTARYASPEQIKGLKVDQRSDLYSLGVVLYEMLTGKPPFLGTDDEVMEQHVRAKPVRPRQWREEIPEGLESIVLRCLEKDRESRYQTAEELAADLRGGHLAKEAVVTEETVEGNGGKRKPIAALAVIGVVLLIGLAALAVLVWPRPGGSRDDTAISVGADTTPAHQSSSTGAATDGSAPGEQTQPGVATPAEAALAPTATPFAGKIAFLSGRDHRDVEPLNSWRPVELYTMNPDGSDETRLTFADTPLSEVGGHFLEVRRVSWVPGEEQVIVHLSAVPDVAAFFRTSDGQLDRTLEWTSDVNGQTIYADFLDFSPDGALVSFTGVHGYAISQDAEWLLWVANSDGSEWRPVVASGTNFRPVWSPDGHLIAFTRNEPRDEEGLYVVGSDGTGLRLLAPGLGWITKAWSPDGTRLATEIWEGHDIVMIDVATGTTANLTRTPDRDEVHPTWSPDGSQIAFQVGWGSDGEIWSMNADGSGAHKIADGCCPAWQPGPQRAAPAATDTVVSQTPTGVAVMPAGGRLAFTSDRDGNDEIYMMNTDGSGVTRVTNNPGTDRRPACSPDGTRIAFESWRDGNWEEIYAMNADGSAVTRLTNNAVSDVEPAWSPDGMRLAFTSERDGNLEIYVMNADGSAVIRLTNNPAGDGDPAWSPDGTRFAFTSERDGYGDIYVMNADGNAVTRVTDNPAYDWHPAWSPDGTRLAFESDRDGNWEVYIMNVDGSGQRNLTNNLASDEEPSWSPDGRYIAFASDRDGNGEIYVMNAYGAGLIRLTNHAAWDGAPSWSPG